MTAEPDFDFMMMNFKEVFNFLDHCPEAERAQCTTGKRQNGSY